MNRTHTTFSLKYTMLLNKLLNFAFKKIRIEINITVLYICTVCPRFSDPFHIASLLYKMGHYFLDIL